MFNHHSKSDGKNLMILSKPLTNFMDNREVNNNNNIKSNNKMDKLSDKESPKRTTGINHNNNNNNLKANLIKTNLLSVSVTITISKIVKINLKTYQIKIRKK